jgi:hypothetical protein
VTADAADAEHRDTGTRQPHHRVCAEEHLGSEKSLGHAPASLLKS